MRWLDASATDVNHWHADRPQGVRVAALDANDSDRLACVGTKADQTAKGVAAKTNRGNPCAELIEEGLEGEDGCARVGDARRPDIDKPRPPTARICESQTDWEETPARRPAGAGDRKDSPPEPERLHARLNGPLRCRGRLAEGQCVRGDFAACQAHINHAPVRLDHIGVTVLPVDRKTDRASQYRLVERPRRYLQAR
jgi:hypothetical protein